MNSGRPSSIHRMGAQGGSELARDRLLAMAGCPTTQRVSARTMGRIAYGLGLASLSWGAAVIGELNPTAVRTYGGAPSPVVAVLVQHAAPALLVVLPIAVTCAVFSAERRRHLAALFLVPFAYALALIVHFSLYWQYGKGSGEDRPADLPDLIGTLLALTIVGAVVAAFSALPVAPILSFARAGESDDHDARARFRVGVCLAAASIFHLAIVLLIVSSEPTELWEQPFYGLAPLPAALALVFGLVEIVRSRRLSTSLGDWLWRVRSGEVHGLRIRDKEAGDASLYLPDVIGAAALEDLQVLEAYAECTDAGPYRMKRSSSPLGLVPRE